MATLFSEDQNYPTKIILLAGAMETIDDQQWQKIRIELISHKRIVQTYEGEKVFLCRTPTDEVELLIETLGMLLSKTRDELIFEPSEPSFEFSFRRTRRGGIQVEAWLDAGNGDADEIYTWDAAGIRFYTTDANVEKFVEELRQDFKLGA